MLRSAEHLRAYTHPLAHICTDTFSILRSISPLVNVREPAADMVVFVAEDDDLSLLLIAECDKRNLSRAEVF